ncbi:MAG: HAMP domain-containing sensor histidine kinase [Anaerolineales bacterium]
MRSISIKIFLVLLVVSVVGALFTTFYLQFQTRNAFDAYIQEQNQSQLADQLIVHFQEQGSWENVDEVFQAFYFSSPIGGQGKGNQGAGFQGRSPNRLGENSLPLFVLADQNGVVLSGFTNHSGYQEGVQLPENIINKSLKLELEGDVIGYLAAVPTPPNRTNIQQTFLETVKRGLLVSALVTLLIALVLGGFLIMSFTKPIRKLADATERVANGELGYQVDIKSSDELGRLATSFNSMSSDLKNADLSRKQMTADIAHDLRTPLSILHGYTEAMSEGKLDGTSEIYQVMHQQAQHLNYLIDDLRTLSLLDSNELSFQIQKIDPETILNQTLAAFLPLAQEKNISISLEIESPLPRITLDPDRLTQILGNLVSNAVNLLSEGDRIWLKTWNEPGKVNIKIRDNGPGISAEDLPHIFDRHYRTDKSRTRGPESSGLGLAITRKLVEAQGGEITANSEIGRGTAFTISFPTA